MACLSTSFALSVIRSTAADDLAAASTLLFLHSSPHVNLQSSLHSESPTSSGITSGATDSTCRTTPTIPSVSGLGSSSPPVQVYQVTTTTNQRPGKRARTFQGKIPKANTVADSKRRNGRCGRTKTSCDACRVSKSKCDGNIPCSRCSRKASACNYTQ